MNILILNWRDIKNPSAGGAEILTHEIAKRWVKWGHRVTQFSSSFPGCLGEEIIDGVRIIRRGHPDTRRLFSSVHFLAFVYYKKQIRERHKFDVVIDEVHGIPFFTPWYVRGRKVVLICEVAGDLWRKTFGPIFGTAGRIIEKFYLRSVYRNLPYLTISPSTQKDLIRDGVNKKNITILPMGISIPASRVKAFKKEESLTLIFVGRLTVPKGVEDAIYALREISKKNPKTKLWIVGRGDDQYLRHLKRLIKKFNTQSKVIFFGFVPEKEKFTLMAKAHILIHPSVREGFGLTIPEAGVVGTPTVAYNSPGIRDIVMNWESGILLKENSPTALASSILDLFNDKTAYERLCRMARQEARKYNWDNTARATLRILESL